MMKDLLLAIDIGTGSARAALVSLSGSILAFAAKEYEQIVPRFAWSQQRPQTWWDGVVFAIRRVLEAAPEAAERIGGIAACGQMHGTVLIDEYGELVLEEVPLWNDKRTRELVARFQRDYDVDALRPATVNPPAVAWPAFKLAWIKENAPKAYKAARTFLTPKDYVNFKLTGERRIDFCEASCSYMFDVRTRDWSKDLLRILDLDPDKLPPLGAASDLLGEITKEAAQVTGLREGTPVALGAGDFPAALLGSGVTHPGQVSEITGTSTLVAVISDRPAVDPSIANLFCATGNWAAFTIVDATGDAIRWARSLFQGAARDYDALGVLADNVPAGSEGLLFLPFLNGERFARKANSRAQFFGLTSRHTAGHLHRAILEGVGFASKRLIESMRTKGYQFNRIIAAGGGAKSRLWLEIKASIYNCPIVVPAEPECGVVGCAMLAGAASGANSDIDTTIRRQIRYAGEVLPNKEWSERYEKTQKLFNDLYETSERFWDRFETVNSGLDS
ncbi:MAG TPA: FGGY family carbohydrate kinase [Chthoniobacterales bacterium]|nr:FGGY family carbohydrate kinase [Chthoniobacterales bacterium]